MVFLRYVLSSFLFIGVFLGCQSTNSTEYRDAEAIFTRFLQEYEKQQPEIYCADVIDPVASYVWRRVSFPPHHISKLTISKKGKRSFTRRIKKPEVSPPALRVRVKKFGPIQVISENSKDEEEMALSNAVEFFQVFQPFLAREEAKNPKTNKSQEGASATWKGWSKILQEYYIHYIDDTVVDDQTTFVIQVKAKPSHKKPAKKSVPTEIKKAAVKKVGKKKKVKKSAAKSSKKPLNVPKHNAGKPSAPQTRPAYRPNEFLLFIGKADWVLKKVIFPAQAGGKTAYLYRYKAQGPYRLPYEVVQYVETGDRKGMPFTTQVITLKNHEVKKENKR